ncbi:MAG: tetratricopeptide repeat protein [Vicinamibacterales bacterium]
MGFRQIRSLYPRITENHLRYLDKWGLLRPSHLPRTAREYSFPEIQTIKQLAAELERGTPLKTILRSLVADRQGQMQLDFADYDVAASDAPRAKVVALEPHRARRNAPPQATNRDGLQFPFTDPQSALAAKYFVEGSRLDDGEDCNMAAAAAAYRKALIIDPDLVPAVVNLANIHYSRDQLIEAQALYERAIGLEEDCFEAHFNLGNILHDLGRYERALICYRTAVALNPSYADAHFYLAVTLEKAGHSPEAKPHWKTYQELAPNGEWAELAKEFTE